MHSLSIFRLTPAILLLLAGCAGDRAENRTDDGWLVYHNAEYDFSFTLPADWRGYSVLQQEWEGLGTSGGAEKAITREHGPVVVLRHPLWRPSDRYQDIPIEVFTLAQWAAGERGEWFIGAGGYQEVLCRNASYVFAIHSRYNADDSLKAWHEASEAVDRNIVANGRTGP